LNISHILRRSCRSFRLTGGGVLCLRWLSVSIWLYYNTIPSILQQKSIHKLKKIMCIYLSELSSRTAACEKSRFFHSFPFGIHRQLCNLFIFAQYAGKILPIHFSRARNFAVISQ